MIARSIPASDGGRRIAFFGLFGVSNIGNEASLRTAISVARRIEPNADLCCICHDPIAVEREHGLPCTAIQMGGAHEHLTRLPRVLRAAAWPLMELARWIAAYRFLRSVDVVIVPGTGILDDFGERPWGMPLSLLRWSLLTRLTRTRLAFVGIGAGPVQSRVSRLIFRLALSFADNCSYRDTGSRDYMRSIGRDTQADGVIPDIVFALEVPHLEPVTDTMGVGVMAYYGWSNSQHKGEATYQRYIEALTETVKQLRADGWRIRLLVGEASDERAVKDIMGRLACKSPEVNELVASRITSMDDLIGELNRVGVVFATRYHNVVGALLAGRPVISAGYAPKNDWLLEQVGLREYCQSVEDFRPSKVVESSRRLRKELPVRFREISAQTNEWKLLVEAGFRAALASKR